MVDLAPHKEQPSRSSSLERKQPCSDVIGLTDKLDNDNSASAFSTSDAPVLSKFHGLSSSDEDCAAFEDVLKSSDPLDGLYSLSPSQPSLKVDDDEASFLGALDELSGCFRVEEPKRNPVSEPLASILNVTLNQRPNCENVKTTCGRLKLPNNVFNMNSAISKIMTVGGKRLEINWLIQTAYF
ncbi:hypothetical protein E2C01_046417 [Portunus trituberculatus]|uniref:Uncharacterized protein n=1 Tax=Portunus trituberculatus TaxID=210409 RepID=A0A5B7G4Q7_PORTR|nr:hypothetical protein [Portunus trituberculatus]